ncbi:MAG: SHOCT-like domain-containing protein [Bacillota bacterium]
MSEERMQILKMLEKGTIDAVEANELLSTLEKRDTVFEKPEFSKSRPKYIKILVEENGEEKVNISIPILLAKTALKIMPKKAKEQMEDQNVNLDSILAAIDDDSAKGKIVDINDDGDHVSISLE